MANTSTTTVTTETQKKSKFSEFMNKPLFGSEKIKIKHAVVTLGVTALIGGGAYYYNNKKQG
jgi:hypothetical protein